MNKTTKKIEFTSMRDAQYVIDNDIMYPNSWVKSAKEYVGEHACLVE